MSNTGESQDAPTLGETEESEIKAEASKEEADADSDAPDLDSSDEESSGPDEYEEDGFMVHGDEDDDDDLLKLDAEENEAKSTKLKRLTKGVKRKRLELDQEDLDLIARNQGMMPYTKVRKPASDDNNDDFPSSRPKATPGAERHGDSVEKDEVEDLLETDSEDDEFLTDDDGDENDPAKQLRKEERKKQRRERKFSSLNYEQFEDANAIYDDEWLKSRYEGDEDDLWDTSEFDTDKQQDKFAKYQKQYEPGMIEELFLTAKDEDIRNKDLPERFQIEFPTRQAPSESQLLEESDWVFNRLSETSYHLDSSATEKIKTVLTFILVQNLEIPFIAAHRMENWFPTLKVDELWKIADLDRQWYSLFTRKQGLITLIDKVEASLLSEGKPDLRLTELKVKIDLAASENTLADLSEYFLFHFGESQQQKKKQAQTSVPANPTASMEMDNPETHNDTNSNSNSNSNNNDTVQDSSNQTQQRQLSPPKLTPVTSKPSQFKKASSADTFSLARQYGLEQFFPNFGMTPEEFLSRLQGSQASEPNAFDSLMLFTKPQDAADKYLVPPFFKTPQSILDGSRALFARELAHHPAFRSKCSEFFDSYASVTTKATQKGKLYIDLNHPYANIRNLKQKPIGSFKGSSTFLQICKAVKEELLELSISVPPSRIDVFTGELGLIFDLSGLYSPDKENASYLWAVQRKKILTQAVEFLMPILAIRCGKELRKEAVSVVISEYQKKLESELTIGGIKIPAHASSNFSASRKKASKHSMDIDDDQGRPATILSVMLNDRTQTKGEMYASCLIVDKEGELKDTLSFLVNMKVEDKIEFSKFMRTHMPFVAILGVDSVQTFNYLQTLKGLIDNFVNEEQCMPIPVLAQPLDVAQIYQSTRQAEKDFPASSVEMISPDAVSLRRKGMSIARRLLDPLMELSVLYKEHKIPSLSLHPLQSMVENEVLRKAIESSFVKVTNKVGVNIYRVCEHPWMQHTLPFVSGMGPRKAIGLIEGMKRVDSVLGRDDLRATNENSPLKQGEILGSTVWTNAIAFINFDPNYVIHPKDIPPLDTTRIHPASYSLITKIQADLKKHNHISENGNIIDAVAKNPGILHFVDINAVIEGLRSKGVDREFTLRSAIQEVMKPFEDPRNYVETSRSKLFDAAFGVSSYVAGQQFTARVEAADRHAPLYEMSLDGGLRGCLPVAGPDAPETRLRRGATIFVQITSVDKESWLCHLTSKVDNPTWEAHKVANSDDYLVAEEAESSNNKHGRGSSLSHIKKSTKDGSESGNKPSIVIKPYIHPRFVNKPQEEVEKLLESKSAGSYYIHPTANKKYLTITSKFDFGTFSHITVEDDTAQNKLMVGKDEYENIDDLVIRFIEPIQLHSNDLREHACFRILNKTDMTEAIQKEKKEKPIRAPYNIAPSQEKPGYYILYYIPGSSTVRKEYLQVVPDGFKYRSIVHRSMNTLLAYFKKHHNDPQYPTDQHSRPQHQPHPSSMSHYPRPMEHPYGYGAPRPNPAPQWPHQGHYPPQHMYPSGGMPMLYSDDQGRRRY